MAITCMGILGVKNGLGGKASREALTHYALV